MSTLFQRVKSNMQNPAAASPEREARLKAAAELRQAIDNVYAGRKRIDAIRVKKSQLSATIGLLEMEDAEARKAKATTMVAYAAGQATEDAVTQASTRARDIASRLSDAREMHNALEGEVLRAESDSPPSRDLDGIKERSERVFWAAVFAEIAAMEAPDGVQEWIRRCWAVFRVYGYGGLTGMYAQLFAAEFDRQEMETIRQDIEREFLSDSAPV